MTALALSGAIVPADSRIGLVVEHYRIERVLGSGGMGVVYLARHEDLGSWAAVKMILPQSLADPTGRDRFVREAKLLSRVQTAGLVRVDNIGQLSDGTPYILMEYLQGQTLSERLAANSAHRLQPDAALILAEQIAATLAELHAGGVVHRDLKPSNIMLVPDPLIPGGERVKLIDFGIAKLVEANTAATLTRGPLGTPLYMSPESCEGKSVRGAADVYSLGCVMYEALCGCPPYDGEDRSVMAKHLFQTPTPLHHRVPALPRAIEEFVLALMARDPEDRPSAAEVAGQARRLQLAPRQVGWRWPWLRRRMRSHKVGTVFACMLGMSVLFFGVLAFFASNLVAGWIPWPALRSLLERSPMVRIPAGRLEMGSSAAEIQSIRELAMYYDRILPRAEGRYTQKWLDKKKDYLGRESQQQVVELVSFDIDRHEVTNQEFVLFLNRVLGAGRVFVDGKCPSQQDPKEFVADSTCVYQSDNRKVYFNLSPDARYAGIRYEGGQFLVMPREQHHPVTAMSWQAAADYCQSLAKRLPTQAEWEYVARRGGRRFPWGSEPPLCEHAILERCGVQKKEFCSCPPGLPFLPDVGSAPRDRTLDGVYDMGGSVSEWTADQVPSGLAPDQAFSSSTLVPSPAPTQPRYFALRGGAWTLDFLSARGAARFRAEEVLLQDDVGFRCVRDVK